MLAYNFFLKSEKKNIFTPFFETLIFIIKCTINIVCLSKYIYFYIHQLKYPFSTRKINDIKENLLLLKTISSINFYFFIFHKSWNRTERMIFVELSYLSIYNFIAWTILWYIFIHIWYSLSKKMCCSAYWMYTFFFVARNMVDMLCTHRNIMFQYVQSRKMSKRHTLGVIRLCKIYLIDINRIIYTWINT